MRPLAHAVHEVAAPPNEYVFSLQLRQAPAEIKLPGGHDVTAGARHAVEEVEPVAPFVLYPEAMREHGVHDVSAPPKLYVSAGHTEHAPALR